MDELDKKMKEMNYAYLWIHLIRSERKDSHISHFVLTTELLFCRKQHLFQSQMHA